MHDCDWLTNYNLKPNQHISIIRSKYTRHHLMKHIIYKKPGTAYEFQSITYRLRMIQNESSVTFNDIPLVMGVIGTCINIPSAE